MFQVFKENIHGRHCIYLDKEGLDLYYKFNWSIHKGRNSFYLFRNTNIKNKKSSIQFHRELLGVTSKNQVVDHINGNGLDNRFSNIRVCSQMENTRNCRKHIKKTHSKYKGVTYRKSRGKYQAQIKVNYKYIYLGCFYNENDAARAYNSAALKHFGSFAYLNLLDPTIPVSKVL